MNKAFSEIDDWNYGYIDRKNLTSFLRKHGVKADKQDVVRIIRRMDLDGDARLTHEEFVSSLIPQEEQLNWRMTLKLIMKQLMREDQVKSWKRSFG